MATTKTYSFSLVGITMADFDNAVSEYYGYDPVKNAGETKAQFGRRNILQFIREIFLAGAVDPVVESARETTISSLGTIA